MKDFIKNLALWYAVCVINGITPSISVLIASIGYVIVLINCLVVRDSFKDLYGGFVSKSEDRAVKLSLWVCSAIVVAAYLAYLGGTLSLRELMLFEYHVEFKELYINSKVVEFTLISNLNSIYWAVIMAAMISVLKIQINLRKLLK